MTRLVGWSGHEQWSLAWQPSHPGFTPLQTPPPLWRGTYSTNVCGNDQCRHFILFTLSYSFNIVIWYIVIVKISVISVWCYNKIHMRKCKYHFPILFINMWFSTLCCNLIDTHQNIDPFKNWEADVTKKKSIFFICWCYKSLTLVLWSRLLITPGLGGGLLCSDLATNGSIIQGTSRLLAFFG